MHTVVEQRVWAAIAAERKKRGLEPGQGVEAALEKQRRAEIAVLEAQAAALKAQALDLMKRHDALLAKAKALASDR